MTNKPMLSVELELLEGLLRECAIEFSTAEASQFELGMLVKIRSALGDKASDQEGSMADGWQFMPMAGSHKEQWIGCRNRSEMDDMKRRGLPVRNLYAEQPFDQHQSTTMSFEQVRDGIADFLADNMSMKKYTLAEVERMIREVAPTPTSRTESDQ